MALKLSTNQRSEDCACVNAAAAIIMPPNVVLPPKYSGAATRIGAMPVIQPKPAVTQVRLVRPRTSRRMARHDVAEMHLDAAALVGLALRERDAVDVLVDADEREAQVRLARVALGVAPDEAAADEIAQQRADDRIEIAAHSMKPGTA